MDRGRMTISMIRSKRRGTFYLVIVVGVGREGEKRGKEG